jgi:hypothetical protein
LTHVYDVESDSKHPFAPYGAHKQHYDLLNQFTKRQWIDGAKVLLELINEYEG